MSFKNKKFSNTIYSTLKENKFVPLRILVEEDEDTSDKKSASNEESASDDPFAMDDSEDDSGDEDSSEDKSDSDDPFGDSESSDSDESESSDSTPADAVTADIEAIKSTISSLELAAKERQVSTKETDFGGVLEGYSTKNQLKRFTLLTEENADELFKDLESALEKHEDLIDKAKIIKAKSFGGEKINVEEEVASAISKLVNFDSKVNKVELIEDLFVYRIKSIAPVEEIQSLIADFKERYAEEVHKNRSKIDVPGSKHYNDESVYLDKNDTYNGAAGARSQG